MRLAFLLVLLLGCEATTQKARLRSAGRSHLANCILKGVDVRECLRRNALWCRAVGLEASCGADEYWPPPTPRAESTEDER